MSNYTIRLYWAGGPAHLYVRVGCRHYWWVFSTGQLLRADESRPSHTWKLE